MAVVKADFLAPKVEKNIVLATTANVILEV